VVERGGRVAEIHRFPVKSVGGERVAAAEVGGGGLVGDRLWAVETRGGHLASGKNSRRLRRRDGVFDLVAETVEDDAGVDHVVVTFPTGNRVQLGTPLADRLLSTHLDEECRFSREGTVSDPSAHMDAAPVSVVGTATLRAYADLVGDLEPVDPRHLRANVVVETDEPWVEERWLGRHLLVGGVDLAVTERIARCRMVDVGQVGVPPHGRLLAALADRDLCVAVYARVDRGGVIRPDDDVCVR
jgi:uncharacterized protein YcbX